MSKQRIGVVLVLIALTSSVAGAQFFRGRRGGFGARQNLDVARTEFIFARWQYALGSGWSHDYPDAEEHITRIIQAILFHGVEGRMEEIERVLS